MTHPRSDFPGSASATESEQHPHQVPGALSRRAVLGAAALGLGALGAGRLTPAEAHGPGAPGANPGAGKVVPEPPKFPGAIGTGGAVASVDPYVSDVGLKVLREGGNAADAAVAMAATLGLTEPFSSGVGGGGFFVFHDASSGQVHTINGRETAPASYTETEFTDENGDALDFDEVVNSGRSIGVPGTPATWALAVEKFGTQRFAKLLKPAEDLARSGFVVDQNFHEMIESNAERFAKFPATAKLFLPGGRPPAVGSTFINADLAKTYRLLRTHGIGVFYRGEIASALVKEVSAPSTAPGVDVAPGKITAADLSAYRALPADPTVSHYRGLDVFGMDRPSSGGIAVGEVLNLLQQYEKRTGVAIADLSEADYLHRFSEACATAFADRNRWVGDVPDIPVTELLSEGFAAERAALFDPERAQPRPIPFGNPDGDYDDPPAAGTGQGEPYEGPNTTHLNVVDRWGNVASYTLTIEQTGGSGITLPGYGFLLNNELTDFNFVPLTEGVPDPNLPGPGKRPRSSMSPTILRDGKNPVLTVGTPGGATIITSVAQMIVGHTERGLSMVDAVAAPRLSSRNGSSEGADLGLDSSATGKALIAKGHKLTKQTWIGNGSGISIHPGELEAAAETVRGGGGSARVISPR